MNTRALLRNIVFCGVVFGGSQLVGATIDPCGASLGDLISSAAVCTLPDGLTVSGFGFSASSGAPLSASDINVTSTVDALGNVDVHFGASFTNDTGSLIAYTFDYLVDPALPTIKGASLSLDPAGVLTEEICAGGTFAPGCTPPGVIQNPLVTDGSAPVAEPFKDVNGAPLNVTIVDYHLVYDLFPGDTAGGFDSGSTIEAGGEPTVPEPSAGLLAGWGLLGFLGFRSRTKLRQVIGKFLS